MRICIFGAGASGSFFAVRLAQAGHDVSIVARGAHLAAVRQSGITVQTGSASDHSAVRATDIPDGLGVQDLVLVTVKATALAAVPAAMKALAGPDTLVVFAQNGMPWWYPHNLPSLHPTPPNLPIFDLGRRILAVLSPRRVMAGLIYSANELVGPGIVRNVSPGANRLDVGPIDVAGEHAVEPLRHCLAEAGIASPPVASVREAVWRKLLLNMSGSTIALATGNRSSISREDDELGLVFRRVVSEGLAICSAHGFPLEASVDPAAMRERLNQHKPSLLQDYEAGRPLELAEIILAPVLFARSRNVPVPTLETLAAIVRRLAIDRGLYVPT